MTIHLHTIKASPMPDLLSGLGYVRLTDAIESALDAVAGHRHMRSAKFLTALHAAGFDVAELAGGPIAPRVAADVEDERRAA